MHENQGGNYMDGEQQYTFNAPKELQDVQELGKKGLRCISYAYKTIGTDELEEVLNQEGLNKEQAFEQYL